MDPASDTTHIIADEVDRTGADVPKPDTAALEDPLVIDEPDLIDASVNDDPTLPSSRSLDAATAVADAIPLNTARTIRIPPRPTLKRESSTPAPESSPQLPPPHAQPQISEEPDGPTDSLSLAQLKKLVTELPKVEPAPYAFKYEDMACFEEELSDLFGYTDDEKDWLLRSRKTFAARWECHRGVDHGQYEAGTVDWVVADKREREAFLEVMQSQLFNEAGMASVKSLECLTYVVLGSWYETAGIDSGGTKQSAPSIGEGATAAPKDDKEKWRYSQLQLQWIQENVRMLVRVIGVKPIMDCLISSYNNKP
jgi:hypothetical protein